MAYRTREDEYLYSSARIRALENSLIGGEELRRLCGAKTPSEVLDGLSAHGYDLSLPEEPMLTKHLADGFGELCAMGGADVIRPLRIPYDGATLKTVIKCTPGRLSPEGLTVDGLSSVSYAEAMDAYERGDFSCFPAHLKEAASRAIEAFAESGNPQTVDALIDRACFADMSELAEKSEVGLLKELIAMKADLCNLQMAVRLCRMGLPAVARALYENLCVPGGVLPPEFFFDPIKEGGEALLGERLSYTPYDRLSEVLTASAPLWVMEREADNARMRKARQAFYLPFGAELMVGYAMALEYECTDLRILLAMKKAGASAEAVAERLRTLYV